MPEMLNIVGRTVQDRRPKQMGKDFNDPTAERYEDVFGEVVSQSDTGFQVKWPKDEGGTYQFGYAWCYLGKNMIELVPKCVMI